MSARLRMLRAAFVAAVTVMGGCAQMGLYTPGNADAPELLRVVLTDSSIDVWPRLVARGKVGLEIVNDGQLEHAFRIVGPGTDEQSVEFLTPGEHRRISLKLGPGTFSIFCPDGDHAERGMWARLVVADDVGWSAGRRKALSLAKPACPRAEGSFMVAA